MNLTEKIALAIWETKSTADYPWWNIDYERCRLARALARAALSAIEKSGTHVVVPVRLTGLMAAEAEDASGGYDGYVNQDMWSAMLSARPPLPETEGKG